MVTMIPVITMAVFWVIHKAIPHLLQLSRATQPARGKDEAMGSSHFTEGKPRAAKGEELAQVHVLSYSQGWGGPTATVSQSWALAASCGPQLRKGDGWALP